MRALLLLLLATACAVAQDQPADPHPLDAALDTCLTKAQGTPTNSTPTNSTPTNSTPANSTPANSATANGMIGCIDQAYREWDHELNRVYQALFARLSISGRTNLREAQRRWVAFRDAEFLSIDTTYTSLQGAMWVVAANDAMLQLVRTRTLTLTRYLRDLEAGATE